MFSGEAIPSGHGLHREGLDRLSCLWFRVVQELDSQVFTVYLCSDDCYRVAVASFRSRKCLQVLAILAVYPLVVP